MPEIGRRLTPNVMEIKGPPDGVLPFLPTQLGMQDFFDHFAEILMVLDEHCRVTYGNPEALRIFRQNDRQVLSEYPWDLWPMPIRRQIEEEHRRAFTERLPVTLPHPFAGNPWLELRCFQCEMGTIVYYFVIAEKGQTRELGERLAAITESSDDAIIGNDLDGKIRSWNWGAEQLFGYRAEEIVGQDISLLSTSGSADDSPTILKRIAGGERVEHYETARRTKDGKVVDVSLTSSPIHDSSGAVVGASNIARDITGRKKASEFQDRLAGIVESANDAVVSKDLSGIIQSWNDAAERLFGYESSEVIGTHISTLAPGGSDDEFPEILARVAQGERIDNYETRRKAKDGRILTVSLSVSPVRDSSGAIVGASKVIRNVTENARDETQISKANAALVRSNVNLQQFAYSASHDLQEPLRMITIYTELLKRDCGGTIGPLGEEYIAGVLAGTSRMQQLLADLRSYMKVSEGEQKPCGEIDSGEIFDRVLLTLDSELRKSGAFVTRSELPRLRVLDFHLEQLFQNLLGNALKYRGVTRPRIQVAAKRQANEWLFSIRDNGIGIAPQYHQQIFQAFRRLHSSDETPGTGLGLAICQGIVDRLEGRIWVESEVGQETTFFFTIPDGKR